MRRAQTRDREAFEQLVEQHATEMYRLASAIVGSADAADVAQETFVAAWQQLPRLRETRSFHPWLRRICINRSRNWLRGSKRRGLPASLTGDEAVAAESLRDHRADFARAVEARVVLEPAFERLTPDQRAVLALHYSMGFSIADAADALGVRVGTAKSRLNAALTVLRKAVAEPERDTEPESAS